MDDDVSFRGGVIGACVFMQKYTHTRDDSHVTQGDVKVSHRMLKLHTLEHIFIYARLAESKQSQLENQKNVNRHQKFLNYQFNLFILL